jgi:hypothetical protein
MLCVRPLHIQRSQFNSDFDAAGTFAQFANDTKLDHEFGVGSFDLGARLIG